MIERLLVLYIFCVPLSWCVAQGLEEGIYGYSNNWVVKLHGGNDIARIVARDLGFTYKYPIPEFEDHHLLQKKDLPRIAKESSDHLTQRLLELDEVKWAEQQEVPKWSYRGFIPERRSDSSGGDNEGSHGKLKKRGHDLTPGSGSSTLSGLGKHSSYFSTDAGLTPQPLVKFGSQTQTFFNDINSQSQGVFNKFGQKTGELSTTISGQSQAVINKVGHKSGEVATTVNEESQAVFNKVGHTAGEVASTVYEHSQAVIYNAGHIAGEAATTVNEHSQKLANNAVSGVVSASNALGLAVLPITPIGEENLLTYEGTTKHIPVKSSLSSPYAKMFNDPFWKNQWYEHDYRTMIGPVMDHNIVPVYKMGITGKGVIVAVCDDGVKPHPDLVDNVNRKLSFDMCHNTRGGDGGRTGGEHGTQCAGEIGMKANNKLCGVGVAYNAQIASVRVLCFLGMITYARGMNHKLDKVDIYSNSWGPTDNGEDMKKSSLFFMDAITRGVTKGRKGKGAIYVFAAGNGKEENDNCAADYVVNNPYTIPITAVSQTGTTTYYSERCTGIFASAYAGDDMDMKENVVSTTKDNQCTTSFFGTSASTPIASGIFALVLEANPNLTYRDMYHLIAMTTEVAPLAQNNHWYKNAAGFWVSNDFGFGLLNALNMVTMAKDNWQTVPKKRYCTVELEMDEQVKITAGSSANIPIETKACQGTDQAIRFLEQIELFSTVTYDARGAIAMDITSPQGTISQILETRKKDQYFLGLHDWSIKSVHNWGENPKGVWNLKIMVNIRDDIPAGTEATVKKVVLKLHGTYEKPNHYNQKRVYAAFRLPNGKTSKD